MNTKMRGYAYQLVSNPIKFSPKYAYFSIFGKFHNGTRTKTTANPNPLSNPNPLNSPNPLSSPSPLSSPNPSEALALALFVTNGRPES